MFETGGLLLSLGKGITPARCDFLILTFVRGTTESGSTVVGVVSRRVVEDAGSRLEASASLGSLTVDSDLF